MALKIDQKKNGNEIELAVEGKLTNSTAPELFDVVDKLDDSITSIIFDFAKLEYISSAGIRVLMSAAKKMDGKGKICVRHCNDSIMEVFTITNLVELFNVEN